ncbi:Mlp family lipoprotein [Borrelia turicatae]|uniref:Mlp family lipoprotein n=1 Tax=Borrelia turicatae TaxID=142 RepID=UPI001FF1EBDB|nr:Mlp family lipoprotein [Borrelia turicatae]UPA13869.1 Mlp family lipoprotein [Borrelia turicatae 91E135]UPA15248.1 Mlp family lipoprotein [Borrelia turicatae]
MSNPQNKFGVDHSDLQQRDNKQTDEQIKFDTIIHVFNSIIKNDNQLSTEKKEKYKKFENWLLQDTQKQKELAEHFQYIYEFLRRDKPEQASNITIKQLLGNTIDCVSSDTCEGRNDVYSYERPDSSTEGERIKRVFEKLLYKMLGISDNVTDNINDKMFKYLKSELIFENSLIVRDLYYDPSQFHKLRFNDSQRKVIEGLLKLIINPTLDRTKYSPQFTTLLKLSNSIIKPVLDHIHNELSKCNGNQKSINDFNNDLKSYFETNEINEETMNKLPSIVIIKCENGS